MRTTFGTGGGEGGSRKRGGVHEPREGVVSGRLGAAPAVDRRTEGLRFDGAAKGGRRGVGSLRLNDIHRHTANANHRARLGIRVNDDVLHRVDVHVQPGEGRQSSDDEAVVMDNGANRRASGGGNCTEVRKAVAYAAATLVSRVWGTA